MMHPELQAVIDEFESAQGRLHDLETQVPEELWAQRPEPTRWSIAECVAHLNLSSQVYLPIIRDALDEARRSNKPVSRRLRRDPIGWMLWKTIGPPVRLRLKTTAAYVPASTDSPASLIAEFDRLQEQQVAFVREADGLPVNRVKVVSPFTDRVKYNLYACLTVLPRHQHRHLWQAQQVWQSLAAQNR